MVLRTLTLMMLLLGLGACSFKKPSAQSPEEKAAAEVLQTIEQQKFDGQLSESNVRVQFLETQVPGEYTLLVQWPQGIPAMKVSLNNRHYQIINNATSMRDVSFAGQENSIHLIALNSIGGEISALALKANAPKDLIINRDVELTENTNYDVNRVYFLNKAKVRTNGFNLSIQTNKLYTGLEVQSKTNPMIPNEAHIVTFPLTNVATSYDQLKGSTIEIKARKAFGQLRIAMIGINGQDGAPGTTPAATSALDGANGQAADVRQDVYSCMQEDGRPCLDTMKFLCMVHPTNGDNGKKGLTGHQGQNGWNGGNSGALAVVIEDSSEFRLEVAQRRGQPGKGGPGGLGSAGGRGGKPGENSFGACRNAQSGAPGPQGDLGAPGADGQPGLIHQPFTNLTNALVYEIR